MSRGKKPKDINAPKKNQSSYFIFKNERRAELQKETGQPMTDIIKIISGEWKEMSNEHKKKYEQLAIEQKKRYEEEWVAYQKTDNYTKYQKQVAEWEAKERAVVPAKNSKNGKKRKMKKPKQPELMPKRPQCSFFIFTNQRRNQMKLQYPDKRMTELSKLIANEWNLKSTEEKKIYEDQAKKLKEKYNEEIKAYKETDEYKQYQAECARFKQAQKEEKKPFKEEAARLKEEYKKKMAEYKGSAEQLVNEWAAECDKINLKAREQIMRETEKKSKEKKPSPLKGKGKDRKSSRSIDEDGWTSDEVQRASLILTQTAKRVERHIVRDSHFD